MLRSAKRLGARPAPELPATRRRIHTGLALGMQGMSGDDTGGWTLAKVRGWCPSPVGALPKLGPAVWVGHPRSRTLSPSPSDAHERVCLTSTPSGSGCIAATMTGEGGYEVHRMHADALDTLPSGLKLFTNILRLTYAIHSSHQAASARKTTKQSDPKWPIRKQDTALQ